MDLIDGSAVEAQLIATGFALANRAASSCLREDSLPGPCGLHVATITAPVYFLDSEQSLDELIEAFERGTLPKKDWTHAAHVAVAGCYVLAYQRPEATTLVRHGILHFNRCHGTANTDHSGYHETLTLFWIARTGEFLAGCQPDASRIDKVRALVECFAPRRDLFREYYTFDVVRSVEARRRWVEPDATPEER